MEERKYLKAQVIAIFVLCILKTLLIPVPTRHILKKMTWRLTIYIYIYITDKDVQRVKANIRIRILRRLIAKNNAVSKPSLSDGHFSETLHFQCEIYLYICDLVKYTIIRKNIQKSIYIYIYMKIQTDTIYIYIYTYIYIYSDVNK